MLASFVTPAGRLPGLLIGILLCFGCSGYPSEPDEPAHFDLAPMSDFAGFCIPATVVIDNNAPPRPWACGNNTFPAPQAANYAPSAWWGLASSYNEWVGAFGAGSGMDFQNVYDNAPGETANLAVQGIFAWGFLTGGYGQPCGQNFKHWMIDLVEYFDVPSYDLIGNTYGCGTVLVKAWGGGVALFKKSSLEYNLGLTLPPIGVNDKSYIVDLHPNAVSLEKRDYMKSFTNQLCSGVSWVAEEINDSCQNPQYDCSGSGESHCVRWLGEDINGRRMVEVAR